MSDKAQSPLPAQEAAPQRPAAQAAGQKAARPGRGKLLWMLLVALAFGGGWMLAGGSFNGRQKETLPPVTSVADGDPSAVMVTVEPVTYRPVQRTVEAVGTLHGFEEVTLSAKVEGRVRKLHFDVADRLEPGDLLLEIDPTDYQLSVQQAERALQVELAKLGLKEPPDADVDLEKIPAVVQARTRLENAQARYERERRLWNTRAVSAEVLDNATADYRAADAEHANQLLLARAGLATIRMKQAALAVARQQLADTKVRVPTPTLPVPGSADGPLYAVTQRSVAEGTLVRAGTEVGKLVIDRTLKLRVPVPERYSPEVRVGQKAEVRTAASPSPFTGTVTRINPAVEPKTRTFEVEIQVPNPGGELKPGSFAKAAILTRLDNEAATVPLDALVHSAGIHKVFLAEGGRAREVRVTPGVQTTEWVEITRPALPPGARVVTSGQTALAADTPVRIRTSAGTGPAAGEVASVIRER
jgi:RND family efflux transporter MFP subunit